jgi:outer membrane protein OmpA-like peptidoglycan-associated protein
MKVKKLISLICIVFIAHQLFSQNTNLMKGCVGKYAFNNNALDDSPSKNNGIVNGVKYTTDRSGKPNSACHFGGGGESIEIKQLVSNDFTVCFWVKTMQVGYNAENGAFYGSTGMVDNECIGCGYDFGVDLLDSRAIFGINEYQLPSTKYINSGQWIHIAAIRDSAQEKMFLYINGKLDTSLNTPEYVEIDTTTAIYFGKLHAASEDQKPFFNGDLDEIYIFKRVLSSGEIMRIAYGGNKPSGFLFNGSEAELNSPIVLRNLQFVSGQFDFLPEGKKELDYVVKWMNENPTVEIELSGHTSNDGDKITNNKLSISRSEICKKYLVSKGINEKRIVTKGYGPDRPVVSNETDEGKQANRRVELKIIKN